MEVAGTTSNEAKSRTWCGYTDLLMRRFLPNALQTFRDIRPSGEAHENHFRSSPINMQVAFKCNMSFSKQTSVLLPSHLGCQRNVIFLVARFRIDSRIEMMT